jgi:hypothetical protein
LFSSIGPSKIIIIGLAWLRWDNPAS